MCNIIFSSLNSQYACAIWYFVVVSATGEIVIRFLELVRTHLASLTSVKEIAMVTHSVLLVWSVTNAMVMMLVLRVAVATFILIPTIAT